MRSSTQQRPATTAEDMGLGPKKTALVLFTVVGCIAILFPKIFYPMIVGVSNPKDNMRGPPNLQKQERPPHLRELIHPGMQERGRAIPPHPSVPILERPGKPGGFPGNIERRPGGPMVPGQPGPSQRAAAYQAQQKQSASQSIIMPIYTFGIVAFFVFTIVKMLMRKTGKLEAPSKAIPTEPDPKFAERVFGRKNSKEEAKKKLVYTAIQGIIEATNEQLSEIERDCAERNKDEHTGHKPTDIDKPDVCENGNQKDAAEKEIKLESEEKESTERSESSQADLLKHNDSENDKVATEQSTKSEVKSEHDLEIEKRLNNLRESMHIRAVENIENSDLKSIYLEGELPNDPQILVSATETETKTEKISHYPSVKDVADDEAVILSGKMTISLISLANNHPYEDEEKNGIVEDHTTATTNNVA